MYENLVTRLRKYASTDHCIRVSIDGVTLSKSYSEAADAIEELSRKYIEERNVAVELTGELASKPRWIPVAEQLPGDNQDVLVMVHWRDYQEDMMCYGRKSKTRWFLWNGELAEIFNGFDVTHWMPLPQPPKEET